MTKGSAPWSSRLLSLYPTSGMPRPDLGTADERGVLLDRGLAALFDLLVCLFVLEAPFLFVVDTLTAGAFGASSAFLPAVGFLLAPILVTYSFAFEWRYARTPGKEWRGLVTVTDEGEPCPALAAGSRNLMRYVDYLGVPPLVVGLLAALVSSSGKRLGDRVAGTVVVRAR